MTRKELCEKVSKLTNIPKREVDIMLAATISSMEKALVDGDTIRLGNFGQFSVAHRKIDTSKNPAFNGKGVIEYTQVKFKPAIHLKMAIKSN